MGQIFSRFLASDLPRQRDCAAFLLQGVAGGGLTFADIDVGGAEFVARTGPCLLVSLAARHAVWRDRIAARQAAGDVHLVLPGSCPGLGSALMLRLRSVVCASLIG